MGNNTLGKLRYDESSDTLTLVYKDKQKDGVTKRVIKRGDWIVEDKGVINHHTIYVGKGEFIARSKLDCEKKGKVGLRRETMDDYKDSKVKLKKRGGE